LVDAGPATKAGLMDVGGALKEQPQVVAELQLETQPRQAGLLDRARAALDSLVRESSCEAPCAVLGFPSQETHTSFKGGQTKSQLVFQLSLHSEAAAAMPRNRPRFTFRVLPSLAKALAQ